MLFFSEEEKWLNGWGKQMIKNKNKINITESELVQFISFWNINVGQTLCLMGVKTVVPGQLQTRGEASMEILHKWNPDPGAFLQRNFNRWNVALPKWSWGECTIKAMATERWNWIREKVDWSRANFGWCSRHLAVNFVQG